MHSQRTVLLPLSILCCDDHTIPLDMEHGGMCIKCGFPPDMQSTCIMYCCTTCKKELKKMPDGLWHCTSCGIVFDPELTN